MQKKKYRPSSTTDVISFRAPKRLKKVLSESKVDIRDACTEAVIRQLVCQGKLGVRELKKIEKESA